MPHPDSLSVHANSADGTGFRKLPQGRSMSGGVNGPGTEEEEFRGLDTARLVILTSAMAAMIGIVGYVFIG